MLILGGCKKDSAEDAAGKSGTEVAAQAEEGVFTPPADGRLTKEQVEMYLEVRRRERQIREGAPAAAGTEGAGPDRARAAQELGHNPREYAWVSARIREAEFASAGKDMTGDLERLRKHRRERLERRLAKAATPEERERIQGRLDLLERRMANMKPPSDPAVQYNVALLAPYSAQLAELRPGRHGRPDGGEKADAPEPAEESQP